MARMQLKVKEPAASVAVAAVGLVLAVLAYKSPETFLKVVVVAVVGFVIVAGGC